MFKFLHAADIHLDSPLHAVRSYDDDRVTTLTTASREALKNLVNLAIEEQVAFLLIAGDVYDGDWDDVGTGMFFNGEMKRLAKAGIRVFAIAGNHDAANHMTRNIPLPENVRYLSDRRPETVLLDDLRVAIHGQGFPNRAVKDNLVLNYPSARQGYFNIGLLHTSLTGSEKHETYCPCTIDDLRARGYDYWALGHVHQRRMPSEADPVIAYSGNLQGRHVWETGPKGGLLVTVDDRGRPEIEFRPFDVIRWEVLSLDASACDSTEELESSLQHALQELQAKNKRLPLVVRLSLTGATSIHDALLADRRAREERFRAVAQNAGRQNPVWLERILFKTRPAREFDPDEWADGPLGTVDALVRGWLAEAADLSEPQEELKAFCDQLPLELWDADEPRFDSPDRLRELLTGVLPLLRRRLLDTGDIA